MNIRKATLKDLETIRKLNQKLFKYGYKFDKTLDCNWPINNKKYFKEAITKKDSLALVALVNNKIIGYFIGNTKKAEDYRKLKKIAEADDAYIIPEYRRRGIGNLLLKKFLVWAKKKGIKRARALIATQNKKSIAWHKKAGFKEYNLTLEKDL